MSRVITTLECPSLAPMVFGEIDAPLEHVSVHGAGSTLVLAGDNLHPVAAAESIVETHALERMGLMWPASWTIRF